jgi:hypothetical protein
MEKAMITIPDISNLPAPDLITLKAAIEARIEEIKQRHMEEAAALGLTLVDGNSAPRRKRRNAQKETE